MTTPTLHLLGGIAISGVPEVAGDRLLAQRKVTGVLAYLCMAPEGRWQSRDTIVGMLWPELTQAQARAALRKATLAIRELLGDDAIGDRGTEEIVVNRQLISCDAAEFEALADADQINGALELYKGEFMPGFSIPDGAGFGMWVDETRAALARRASAITWALAINLEANKQLTLAGQKARDAIRYQWSDERLLRRTMKLLVRIGDRGGAISVYEGTAIRMLRELETRPSRETEDLAAAIRSGESIS